MGRRVSGRLYRAARVAADVEAAERGPQAYVARRARRRVYRVEGRWTRHLFRLLRRMVR